MKGWAIGVVTAACVGVGAYLTLTGKDAPVAVAPPAAQAPATPTQPVCPPAPAVLPEVIELADLDPLLDPPTKAIVGTPFDEAPPVPAGGVAPERIPLAVD